MAEKDKTQAAKAEAKKAQQAEKAVLKDVKQTAWATTAGTFKLSGLKMSLSTGVKECY